MAYQRLWTALSLFDLILGLVDPALVRRMACLWGRMTGCGRQNQTWSESVASGRSSAPRRSRSARPGPGIGRPHASPGAPGGVPAGCRLHVRRLILASGAAPRSGRRCSRRTEVVGRIGADRPGPARRRSSRARISPRTEASSKATGLSATTGSAAAPTCRRCRRVGVGRRTARADGAGRSAVAHAKPRSRTSHMIRRTTWCRTWQNGCPVGSAQTRRLRPPEAASNSVARRASTFA